MQGGVLGDGVQELHVFIVLGGVDALVVKQVRQVVLHKLNQPCHVGAALRWCNRGAVGGLGGGCSQGSAAAVVWLESAGAAGPRPLGDQRARLVGCSLWLKTDSEHVL